MDITIVTSTTNDGEALELFELMGMPLPKRSKTVWLTILAGTKQKERDTVKKYAAIRAESEGEEGLRGLSKLRASESDPRREIAAPITGRTP